MSRKNLPVFCLFVLGVTLAALFVFGPTAKAENAVVFEYSPFDTCRNISFRVSNARSRPILIVKVKYFNADKNKWQTEDVPNVTCPVNQVCYFGSENLAGAENDRLTKIVVVFQDQDSNADQASPQFTVDSPVCRANKRYGDGQNWAIVGGATSGFGFEDASSGSCKNVSFRFKNNRARDIEIRKVKYYNRNENRWQTEDVPNTTCRPGQTCNFGREDLRDSAGDDITKLRFLFHDNHTREDLESAEFNPSTPACTDEKIFGYGQAWTTAGSTVVTNNNNSGNGTPALVAIAQAPKKGGQAIKNADLAGDCKRVTFEVKNNLNKIVRFKSIEYYNRSSGKWKTETLGGSANNYLCRTGEDCTVYDGNFASREILGIGTNNAGSTLGSALGDDITKIKFVYQSSASESGPWSKQTTSRVFEPQSPRCVEGKNYGENQNWALGQSDAGNGNASNGTPTLTQMENGGANPGIVNGRRRNPDLTQNGNVTPAVTDPSSGKGSKGKNKGKNQNKRKSGQDEPSTPATDSETGDPPAKPKAKGKRKRDQ